MILAMRVIAVLLLGIGLAAHGQSVVSPTIAQVYTSANVLAAVAQPDGKVVIGGDFQYVNGVARNRLARLNADGSLDMGWDPNSSGSIFSLAIDANGDVYAGGVFGVIGGLSRNDIAKLSGTTGAADPNWNPGANSSVRTLKVDGSGNLFAGGDFTNIGGQFRTGIAKLSTSGTGTVDTTFNATANNSIYTIALDGAGNAYVGGPFTTIGGQSRNRIARLSTSTGATDAWNPNANGGVNAVALDSGGSSLYVGGGFTSIGGQARTFIAKLSTSGSGAADATWNPNADNALQAIAVDASGNVVAGGGFTTIGGQSRNRIARLSSSGSGAADTWNPNADAQVNALAIGGTKVVAGGSFLNIGGQAKAGFALLDPSTGTADPAGPQVLGRGTIFAIARDAAGGTIIGGNFVALGDATTLRSNIARFNPDLSLDTGWNAGATCSVLSLAVDGSGNLYVGGTFSIIGGQSRNRIARLSAAAVVDATWNPSASATVWALAVDVADVYAGGDFTNIGGQNRNRIAKLSSSGAGAADATWNPSANNSVRALRADGVGNLYVGGSFTSIGGQSRNRIARLSMSGIGAADATWDPDAINTVSALALDGGGNLYAGGFFNTIGGQSRNYLARLSTSGTGAVDATWDPVMNGSLVSALALDGAGSLYVGGVFDIIGGQARTYLAKLSTSGSGAADPAWNANANNAVNALALDGTGRVHAGGSFTTIAGQSRVGYAVVGSSSVPGAPTIVSSTGGIGRLTVSFNPPASNGGATITSYTVTCNPGGFSASSATSPITLTGLSNGVTYTCTVRATNSVGTGTASATVDIAVGAISISSTQSHVLALDANGQVYAWGSDSYGQLGQGRSINRSTPAQVALLPAISDISLYSHALAVDTLGQVWSWGDNSCGGQLGPRESSVTSRPARVIGATGMTKVAAGQCFSLALRSDGTVWLWGFIHGYGASSSTPIRQITGLSNIVQISGGYSHALALRADGVVFAFGANGQGQLGLGMTSAQELATQIPNLTGVTAVAAGHEASMALLSNGETRFWGRRTNSVLATSPTALPGLGGQAVSISITTLLPYAARSDGKILFYDSFSAAWLESPGFAGIVKVTDSGQGYSGESFNLGVTASGQLYAAGGNNAGQLGQGNTNIIPGVVAVPGFSNTTMVRIAEPNPSVLALKADGTVWFWGADTVGQSGDGATIGSSVPIPVPIPATIKAVATGDRYSVALDTAGNVWGWGDNRQGPLGSSRVSRSTPALVAGISGVRAIAAGASGFVLYLMGDGTVQLSGGLDPLPLNYDPTPIAGLSAITAVAAGAASGYALRNDGALLAFGNNQYGSLGNGTTTSTATPVQVQGITGTVTRISAGTFRAGAVTAGGSVFMWGDGYLGNGTSAGSLTAVQVPGIIDAADLSVGLNTTLVRRFAGGVVAWGNTGLTDSVGQNPLLPYAVAFHEPVFKVHAGAANFLGFLIGNTGLAWSYGYFGSLSTANALIGDGAYVPRDRPVVVLAANGTGSVDANNWYLDLDASSAETIPTASTPKALGVSRLFGANAGLSFDATVKYKAADYGKAVNNYVFARVPPDFFNYVKNAPGTPSVPEIKRIAKSRAGAKDEVSVLAQLTPTGWNFVQSQLIAYSQSIAGAGGTSTNILNSFDATKIPGGRFCIGYGESSGSLLTFEALREVLLLSNAASNLSGVPCVLTGLYIDGPSSARANSAVTFKASIVGLGPTGTIQFNDGPQTLSVPIPVAASSQAVSAGSMSISSLAPGTHPIGASYSGDGTNAAASTELPLSFTVVEAPPGESRTSLTGPTGSDSASTVTFTATVAGDGPTGTVQFKDGASNLGSGVPLVGGAATLRTNALTQGAHTITAAYSGDSKNAPSTSSPLSHTVYAVLTTQISLTSSPNPATTSQQVTLTATVTGTIPTGTVTFRDGGAMLAQVALANGSASHTVAKFEAGTHQLTAEYGGDGNNQSVTSAALFQEVTLTEIVLPANPPRLANISTRGKVLTGEDVMIAGFVIEGSTPKTVVINAAGPSLSAYGVANPLANPTMTLVRSADNSVIAVNDDWQNQSADNVTAIQNSGFKPNHALEPAIIATLGPGAYTAVVSGVGSGTGVSLVGVFEVDRPTVPLVNISTRGKVQTGEDVMIAGIIIQGTAAQNVVINVAGPYLSNFGVAGPLANPQLTLVRSSDNAVIATNDNWQTQANPAHVAAIQATGKQPNNPLEPAIIATLPPGAYTAIVSGVGGGTGVAVVGVFRVP
jgi:alpha-tubulin suppressor-like RCC1 family protein